MARSKEMKIAIRIGGMVEASLQKAASKAASCLGSVTKSAARATKIATAAGAATVAVIGKAAADVGKEFETAMSSAAATADATPAQYKKMEEAARAMGRATSKTAAESAAALEYMALAGWDVDTSISALPSVLRMSEASGMELARTSDLITDSMSALGVSVEGLPNYLDVAAKAQNKSNQTAEQLMEAYLGVGGTMNNLGVPITESATALGVLANRGIKGSEAGTALNAVMVNLTTGTGQAGEMMGKLGISAFDSSGKFIGLENTLQQVNAALSGCTDEERNAALAAIGGKQHVDALNDLMAGLNTTNKKGVTEWAALTKELESCDGALEKMAARKMDNLEGDLAILNSAVSDLGISIYKDMNTPLRGAVQLGTQMAETLSKGYGAGGMEGMAASVGTCLADAANAVTASMPKMVTAGVGLVQNLINGVSQNSGALSGAAAQAVGSFMIGMGAVLPQAFLLSMDLVTGFVQGITAQIPQMGTSGASAITEFAAGFSQRLPEMGQAGLDLIQAVSTSLMSNGPQLFNAAVQITGTLATGFMAAVPQLAQMGADMLGSLASGITDNLPQMIPAAMGALMEFSGTLRGSAGQLVDAGLNVVMALADSLITNIPVFVQTVPTIITNLCGIINDNAPKLLTAGITLITKLGAGLIQAIPVIIGSIPQIIQAAVSVVMAFNWLELGGSVIKAIKNGVTGAAKAIPGAFKDICGKAKDALKNVDWRAGGARVIRAIRSGIYDMVDAVPKVLRSIGKKAWEQIKSVDWKDLGIKIIGGIIKGIASTGKALWSTVKNLFLGKKVKVPAEVETPKTEKRADARLAKVEKVPDAPGALIPEKTRAAALRPDRAVKSDRVAKVDQPKVGVPKTKVEVPKIRAEAPKAKVEVPKIRAEAPKAKVEVPKIKAEAPKAKVEIPKIQAEAPKAKVEVPKIRAEAPKVQAAPALEAKAGASRATEAPDTRAWKALETGAQKETGTRKISLANVRVDARQLNAAMDASGRRAAKRLKSSVQKGAVSVKVNLNKVRVNARSLTASMRAAGKRGATALNSEIAKGASKTMRTVKKLGTDINRQMDEAWKRMQTRARTAMDALCATVTQDAQRATNAVRMAFETMVIKIPEPKLPEIKVTRQTVTYGGGGRDQGRVEIPKFTTVWHAEGGIFKKPTLFGTAPGVRHGVGESGPEAVLPLDLLWQRLGDIVNGYSRDWVDQLIIRLSRLEGVPAGQGPQQMQPIVISEGAFVFQTTYNPTYNLDGTASEEDIMRADRASQKELKRMFEKMWKEYKKDLERTLFRRR